MRAEGLNATVSSIHINGWIGDHDKPSGARWAVQQALDHVRERPDAKALLLDGLAHAFPRATQGLQHPDAGIARAQIRQPLRIVRDRRAIADELTKLLAA